MALRELTKKPRKKRRRRSYTVGEFGPRPVDVHVGGRVKAGRTLIGMNQTELGKRVGLSFHQILKYEQGKNRMGASMLWQISLILGQPISRRRRNVRRPEMCPVWRHVSP